MKTLVVGASGATGRLLVQQLLESRNEVKVLVRSAERFHQLVDRQPALTVVESAVLDLSDAELTRHVLGCEAVASCLGHNMSFKGLFGHPRRLVTDATRRLCRAVKANKPETPIRFVLMNTTGNRNRDLPESISVAQKCVIELLRLLLPPHADNEQAAEYLRSVIGQRDRSIEWAAVRPDDLIDEAETSDYEVHASPTRSAVFDAGKTSRINVAHFMSELITNRDTWTAWRGKMPVIYNVA